MLETDVKTCAVDFEHCAVALCALHVYALEDILDEYLGVCEVLLAYVVALAVLLVILADEAVSDVVGEGNLDVA